MECSKNINEPLVKARKSTQRHTVGQRRSQLLGSHGKVGSMEPPPRVPVPPRQISREVRAQGGAYGTYLLPMLVQPRESLTCAKSQDGPFFPKASRDLSAGRQRVDEQGDPGPGDVGDGRRGGSSAEKNGDAAGGRI